MRGIVGSGALLFVTVLMAFAIPSVAFPQDLYGIIGAGGGAEEGRLIKIDGHTGDFVPLQNTGIKGATGMTYNPNKHVLYVTTLGIGLIGGIHEIKLEPFGVTQIAWPGGSYAIEYRFVDDMIYRQENGGINKLAKYDPDGNFIDFLGLATYLYEGLAVRPSDGKLFGVGLKESAGQYWLCTIDTTGQDDPLESDIGPTNENSSNCQIYDLAFVPDGRLFGSDGANLVNVNTSNGEVTRQLSFDFGPVRGLAYIPPDVVGPIDVWMKDCAADTGESPSVPSPCEVAYKSPDIWVDNNNDMIIDAPVVGEENILRAKVRNRMIGTADNVSVKFFYRDNTTGLYFPSGATPIGEDLVTVPPNGIALASVKWTVPPPPSSGGHWCIGVLLNHPGDPLPDPAPDARNHNNIAMANIWYIAGRANEQELLSFTVSTGGRSGFGLQPWPRQFIIEVKADLPPRWSWTLEGMPVDAPFVLKLGDERKAELKVKVAPDAAPHSGGFVEVRQVDVKTGMVVGGLSYTLYEDHRPPAKIGDLRASLVDGSVVLSWGPVRTEAETGLSERVAYYEILRDGRVVNKVLRDGDSNIPGFQWKDPIQPTGPTRYAVRAIDEGENVAAPSNESAIFNVSGATAPCKLFNWITWLLLVIVLLLAALLIRCSLKT